MFASFINAVLLSFPTPSNVADLVFFKVVLDSSVIFYLGGL